MDTTTKIGFTLAIIGIAGCIINALTDVPSNKLKYHIYSSTPLLIGLLIAIIDIIWTF